MKTAIEHLADLTPAGLDFGRARICGCSLLDVARAMDAALGWAPSERQSA